MNYFFVFLKGLGMGSADVIPGVSGGTIAFITGIYDRLLGAISQVDLQLFKLVFTGKWKSAAKKIDFTFLLALFGGILTAVISLAKLITYLLKHHEVALWSFFFGLIVASSYIIITKIKKWNLLNVVLLVIGTLVAYWLTSMRQGTFPDGMVGIFLSGFIAIIAMILPGISGSYILVMMGMYEKILGALTASIGGDLQSIIQILVFILGCILGLLAFSRLLQWLLLHFHDAVVAVLTGFMIGSLNKVWPWKNTLETYLDRHGEVKPLVQENILPPQLNTEFFIALALAVFAFLFVYTLEKISKKAIINV
jgi:putative membrane protein